LVYALMSQSSKKPFSLWVCAVKLNISIAAKQPWWVSRLGSRSYI